MDVKNKSDSTEKIFPYLILSVLNGVYWLYYSFISLFQLNNIDKKKRSTKQGYVHLSHREEYFIDFIDTSPHY